MSAARLFALSAAFAAGVVLAEVMLPPVWLALALASSALCFVLLVPRALVLLAAALALGLALGGLRLARVEQAALASGAARGADALLEGVISGDPQTVGDATRFVLAVHRAEIDADPFTLHERAYVTLRPPRTLRAHSRILLDARLRPVFFEDMDGVARAAARRLRHQGVAARAFASPGDVTVLGRGGGILARVSDAGRNAMRRAAAHLPAQEQGLLLGVTIGDTSLLDPGVELDFRTTGLSHLVAVSGANVAFVLILVALVLRAVRAGRALTLIVMSLSVVSFMAMARFEPSVMRAGVMAGIALTGLAIGARRHATTALGVATLGLMVADPFLVWAPGFQLSVLATAGLLCLSPHIAAALPEGRLARAAAVTLGAQLAVLPLIVLHFHELSLVAVAANLVVAPLVAPATMIGMVAALAGVVWAPLSSIAVATRAPVAGMLWFAHALAQLPFASVGTPAGIGGPALVVVLGAVAAFAWRARARLRRPVIAVVAILLLAATGTWSSALAPPRMQGLVVTMLNVGQGDALLVRAGDRALLIDGGPDERRLLRALDRNGVRRIDMVVLTHPHADHIDGLATVVQRFAVARALDPYIAADLPSYAAFVRALAHRRVPRDRAIRGMTSRLGDASLDVLWPPAEHMEGTHADVNNNSIVLRVRYGAQSVLFAGESQEEAQEELLRAGDDLRADVLKVSHHGSRRMLPEFYAATGARAALIPVGANEFGHPAPQTVAALKGMKVLRSDWSGDVTVALDGSGGLDIREEIPSKQANMEAA